MSKGSLQVPQVGSAPQTAAPARRATNLEQLTAFVNEAAVLFWLAEHEQNPAIQTYWDAAHYISTALSVGYANVFPVTQAGKAIASAVMMVGPALSSRALAAE
jgi:Ion channel